MHVGDTIFIFCLALIIFGPKKLPEIGRQIGKLMFEFRRASNDFKLQIEEELRASEQEERQKEISAAAAAASLAAPSTETVSPEATSSNGSIGPVIAPPSTGVPVNHTFSSTESNSIVEPAAVESAAVSVPENSFACEDAYPASARAFNANLNTASNGAIAETPVAETVVFPTETFPPAEIKAGEPSLEAEKAQAPLHHG